MLSFSGSLVALVTPMTGSGSIDFDALDRLVDFHLSSLTDGLVVLGTTGEAATISSHERKQIITQVISRVAGRIPVIVGTGSNDTKQTIDCTTEAQKLGADGALVVTPYYNKPTQRGLIRHYRSIASAVNLPLIIYNVPSRTGVDMSNETVVALSKEPTIVAIKDATGDLTRVPVLAQTSLTLLSGDDASAAKFVQAGGHGVISVAANIVPKLFKELMHGSLHREKSAVVLDQRLASLCDSLFLESNPIPVKWALSRMGLIGDALRLPLTPLSDQFKSKIESVLSELQIPLLNLAE